MVRPWRAPRIPERPWPFRSAAGRRPGPGRRGLGQRVGQGQARHPPAVIGQVVRQIRRQKPDAHAVGDHGPQHLDRAGLGGDAGRHPADLEQRQEISPAVGQVDQDHRILRQIPQGCRRGARQAVPGRHKHMRRHRLQWRQRQIRGQSRVINQGKVDAPAAQAASQFGQIALDQGDARGGEQGGEAAHKAGRVARPQRRINPQDHLAPGSGGRGEDRAGLGQQRFERGQLLPPEGGRPHPLPRQPQEQRLAEMRLDLGHGLRHRRLRHVHRPRGGGRRARFRDGQQIGDLAKPQGYRIH